MANRILIVANDSLARAGLATLLSNQPNCVVTGQIDDQADLNESIQLYRPDAIVWDLGIDAARTIDHANFRDIAVPVIALLPDQTNASEVWSAGARGLLLRDASASSIASAVNAVVEKLSVVDLVFSAALFPMREQSVVQPVEELTPRELQVLRLMAEGQSNKTIARELEISEHTVKFHVNAILGKLNVQSRTEAVVHATRLGLILL
ncbi:MAG: response regulator transcription factor [Chloroflexi bacterium]|nr:response regulator transcription factor [Chloroflexota bacterium]